MLSSQEISKTTIRGVSLFTELFKNTSNIKHIIVTLTPWTRYDYKHIPFDAYKAFSSNAIVSLETLFMGATSVS